MEIMESGGGYEGRSKVKRVATKAVRLWEEKGCCKGGKKDKEKRKVGHGWISRELVSGDGDTID